MGYLTVIFSGTTLLPFTDDISARVVNFRKIMHQLSVVSHVLLKPSIWKALMIKSPLNCFDSRRGTPYLMKNFLSHRNCQFFTPCGSDTLFKGWLFILEDVNTASNLYVVVLQYFSDMVS